ncbi:MAG: tetratricopeptide repeat protein [Deltaproteobacteria bacterium]|nr:tetratricopeptide repeat protein [Deltaproteobacteria bacterium]
MKRLPLALAVTTLATTIATRAHAVDACMDTAAQRALACGDALSADVGALDASRKGGVDFRAPAPASKPKVVASTPKQPSLTEPRDDRTLRLQARQKGLLAIEARQVENLYATTKKNAPDRVQITRRLADLYVELESAAFRDKTEAEIRRDRATATDVDRTMKGARARAIDLYREIATDFPTHPSIDEVLYYLAYEYEQAGDLGRARAAYYDLVKKAPDSRFVPNAYLAFGELFFVEAQGDPSKWDLAAQAYAEVVKYPAPKNKVQGYARYKLAYVFWNKGELDKALDSFKKTIEHGVAHPTLPGATKLAESARRDLVPVYALEGDPAKAYDFMHGVSGDPPGSNDKTFAMLADLGASYLDTGHYPEGIVVFKDLMTRDRGGRSCGYQAHVTEAVMAMKASDKDAIKGELEAQIRVAESFRASSAYTAEQKQSCSSKSASLVIETAMAWHLEAVGSQGQRGTSDAKTMKLAAQLYERAASTWSAKEIASFEFPRIVKEDWPTLFRIKYALADLLYSQKDWAKCGPAFGAVALEDPRGPEAAKARYAEALCYQNLYEATHKDDAGRRGGGHLPGQVAARGAHDDARTRLSPKEMKPELLAMVHAFDRYVCNVKPAANDDAAIEQLVEVKYARARTYFEANHWEEAALAFREIALSHPDRASGVYAAQLYLESANVLYTHFGKTTCRGDMAADVPKILDAYCGPARAAKNPEVCGTLKVVQVDLLRLEAQELVAKAQNATGTLALELFDRGGQAYFELFRKYCQDPTQAGRKPEAERCDEIAYNAASAFQAGRLLAKAITARKALLAFDVATRGSSPLAKKSTYEIGANYQAIAVYDQAAEWYERYAKSDPRAENAERALSDAVVLRLGLGHEKEAFDDAHEFTRAYGAPSPAQAAAIAYAIGAHHAEKEEWEKARAALAGSISQIDRAAPDIQVQAHATHARALAKLGKVAEAQREYTRVRSLWTDPASAEAKIRAAYPGEDDAQKDRRLGRALDAVGEALFFLADQRRIAEVEPIKFPEYRGAGDKASVKAHIETKVKEWLQKKRAAIEKVEPEYAKILALEPAPPPKWIIAAGSRSGLMWSDFVDDFRRSPIPRAWKGTELEHVYYDEIDRKSEPFKANLAKPALKKCLDLSTKHQYSDAFSRSCELWLAKNYKQEYHAVDELRAAPTLGNGALAEKSPPLLAGGALFHPPPPAGPASPKPAAPPAAPTPKPVPTRGRRG